MIACDLRSLAPLKRARRTLGSCGRWWVAGIALLIALPLPPARATPAQDPDNGHYYDAITANQGILWETARTAAGKRTYRGLTGHLATVTSLAENRFIDTQFPETTNNGYWLGGFQIHGILDPAAGWQWVTGEPWGFTNWNQEGFNEPNDYYGLGTGSGDENKLQFWYGGGGRWNDSRNSDPGNPAYGYVVEYERDLSPNPPAITGYATADPRGDAVVSAAPGSMLRITGANLGSTGTALFDGIPLPAAVASWSPTEILLWVPTAPSYPFTTHVTLTENNKQADGSGFTINAPMPGQDNLLANGSFEFPDSSKSLLASGFTFGLSNGVDARAFRGYGIPGWRVSEGTIDLVNTGWQQAPGLGAQSIDLVGSPGAATLQQTFFTQTGRQYILSGYVAHNPGIPDSRAGIYLNGAIWNIVVSTGVTSPSDMNWVRFGGTFAAKAAQTTVTIRDLSGYNSTQGTALDGLQVTPIY